MKLADRLRTVMADKVPAGWMTRHELARQEGYPHGDGSFFYLLRNALRANLVETRTFRVATTSGLRLVNHYRYTPPKNSRAS